VLINERKTMKYVVIVTTGNDSLLRLLACDAESIKYYVGSQTFNSKIVLSFYEIDELEKAGYLTTVDVTKSISMDSSKSLDKFMEEVTGAIKSLEIGTKE